MKLLVFSDSHGMAFHMREVLERDRSADAVLFCGDGARDIREMQSLFPEKAFYAVRGNCDFGFDLPEREVLDLGGARIFLTHGHYYGVKTGLYRAVSAAREEKANLLVFGHTHEALSTYEDGLYILNPGSISGYAPTYGTVEITPQGLLVNIARKS